MAPYFSRTPIRFRTIAVSALVLATLFLFQAYMRHSLFQELQELSAFNWWREGPVPYLNFLFWALLCPLVYSILRRWPLDARPLARTVILHIGAALLIATLHEVVTSTIYYAILHGVGEIDIQDERYQEWALQALGPAIFTRTLEYGVLMGLLVALDNARMRREEREQMLQLQHELQVTRMNALKKQLQPHFLFNTLNTVSALMDDNIGDARKVLSRLGHLLRNTLDTTQRDKVRLENEMQHVANYLDIESIRFRDRLLVHYEVPAALQDVLVPNLLLQPLVENSIKHGPDATTERVEVRVRVTADDRNLHVQVLDNGKGCRDVSLAMENGGIGLRNVRERLRLLYGDRATFHIASPNGLGFEVTLSIPLERA
ncbi:MAG: histidine kinase [Flavobacteriales bacterium]|nr:histidine kinase [Flavobacteriales bacterium]